MGANYYQILQIVIFIYGKNLHERVFVFFVKVTSVKVLFLIFAPAHLIIEPF